MNTCYPIQFDLRNHDNHLVVVIIRVYEPKFGFEFFSFVYLVIEYEIQPSVLFCFS